MSAHLDRYDSELGEGDFVRVASITDELFRIQSFQFPGDAIIENVIPGGRYGTSTLPCADLIKQIGNPVGGPARFDDTHEQPNLAPMPGSLLPCGCYMRTVDAQPVLCEQHLIEVNTPAE